jgi:AcrR family transcriptional regulator
MVPSRESAAQKESPAGGTREKLITAAERLFAEHGMSVSNRQIGEAAGQGNSSVVGYHFGTKTDLVLAILRTHAADIEQRRVEMLAELSNPLVLSSWLRIVVRPITDHLDTLGRPSWYARFVAQATAHPDLRPLLHDETLAAPSMRVPFREASRLLRHLPHEVFEERADMTRYIVVNTCAERERALHLALPTPRATWTDAADGMVDALVGLWEAPVRNVSRPPRSTRRVRDAQEDT